MAKRTVDTWKRKKWINIIAPKMFHSKSLGQTIAIEPKKIEGRVIEIDLNELLGIRTRQRVNAKFKISEVIDNKEARTKFLGHNIPPSHMKTVVRKRNSKIYVNEEIRTKDGKNFRVKSIMLVDRSTNKSTRTELLQKFKEILKREAHKKNFNEFISELISKRFASIAKHDLHKIYPVKHIVVEKTEISEKVDLPDEPMGRIQQRERNYPENRGNQEKTREKRVETEVKTLEKPEETKEKQEKKQENQKETEKTKEKPVKKPEKKEETKEKDTKPPEKEEKIKNK